jgi:hypothetical protein
MMESMLFNCRYPYVLALVLATPPCFAGNGVGAGDIPATEKCAVLFEDSAGKMHSQLLPSLYVMSLAPDAKFSLPADAPSNVKAIQCGRPSLAPLAADLKVISAGYPIGIVSGGRVGVLSLPEGRLRFNMLDGEMTEAEIKEIGAFLDQGQELLLRQEQGSATPVVAP